MIKVTTVKSTCYNTTHCVHTLPVYWCCASFRQRGRRTYGRTDWRIYYG